MKTIKQEVWHIRSTENAAMLIEEAAAVCWGKHETCSTDSDRMEYLKRIAGRGHESIFEHASATYLLLTDRGITHELVRHRLASYTQESTRYHDYSTAGITVIEPLNLSLEDRGSWLRGVIESELVYTNMINSGAKPQQARDVLPTCMATKIYMTANFREWRHIFSLRCAGGAHPKIAQLMNLVRADLSHHTGMGWYFGLE